MNLFYFIRVFVHNSVNLLDPFGKLLLKIDKKNSYKIKKIFTWPPELYAKAPKRRTATQKPHPTLKAQTGPSHFVMH